MSDKIFAKSILQGYAHTPDLIICQKKSRLMKVGDEIENELSSVLVKIEMIK
jgi:hypothetical protein